MLWYIILAIVRVSYLLFLIAILISLQAVNEKIDGCRRYLLRGSPLLCVQG